MPPTSAFAYHWTRPLRRLIRLYDHKRRRGRLSPLRLFLLFTAVNNMRNLYFGLVMGFSETLPSLLYLYLAAAALLKIPRARTLGPRYSPGTA